MHSLQPNKMPISNKLITEPSSPVSDTLPISVSRPSRTQTLVNACRSLVRSSWLHVGVLVVATVLISTKDITVGDFRHPDAWSHAMNGVFLLDLAKAMPVGHAWEFTLNYFAKYPAISLPYHPPGFPVFEAIVFWLLGVSVVSARVTVVLFGVLAILAWYKLVQRTHDRSVALFSGLLLAGNAMVVELSRQVMLEVPTLAMVVISIYLLHMAVESRSRGCLYLWALTAGAVVWFKQTAGFVVPLSLSYFMWMWRDFRPRFKDIAGSLAIVFAALVPMALITWYFARFALVQVVAGTKRYGFAKPSMSNWLHYFRVLPDHVPAAVLIAAGLSLVIVIWKKLWCRHMVYLLWFVWTYIVISYTSTKSARYAFFLIPPIYLFACSLIDVVKLRFLGIRVANVLLGCLCLLQCGVAYRTETLVMGGFEDAARYVKENWKGQSVVISALSHGNFTFNIRKLDPQGNIMVLRADKVIPELLLPAAKWNDQLLYSALRGLGTKYVVIESADWNLVPELKRLRRAINSGNFTLRKTIPVTGNVKSYQGVDILIYEFLEEVDGSKQFLDMPMPKMGRKLRIPLQK